MAQLYHNPFAGLYLIAPVDQREAYDQYCQRQGTKSANIDEKPFPRMVDFWFAGLSLATLKQLEPVNIGKTETFRFIDGSIFDRDSWRVQAVMLVAIAIEDDVGIVGQPSRMIAIANGLAAAGVPRIVGMLCDGNQDPIWNLSEALNDLLQSDIYTEKDVNRMRLSEALR